VHQTEDRAAEQAIPLSKGKLTRQLLTSEEMGDRKPSQFLGHLRNLDSDVPDRLLRFIWASRLPYNVQVALASMPNIELDTAVLCADRIMVMWEPTRCEYRQPIHNSTNLQVFVAMQQHSHSNAYAQQYRYDTA
jgi:hypothetical protein